MDLVLRQCGGKFELPPAFLEVSNSDSRKHRMNQQLQVLEKIGAPFDTFDTIQLPMDRDTQYGVIFSSKSCQTKVHLPQR